MKLNNSANATGLILPQTIVPLISTINDKTFTVRELDIIACLCNGKPAKKIAKFLNIAPKTVEYHIRNIILKTNTNSRSEIIEFVEKSNKYKLIQLYYSSLIVEYKFEEALLNMLPFINQKDQLNIVFKKSTQDDNLIIKKLHHDLSLLNIKATILNCEITQTTSNEQHFIYNPNKNYYAQLFKLISQSFPHPKIDAYFRDFKQHYETWFNLSDLNITEHPSQSSKQIESQKKANNKIQTLINRLLNKNYLFSKITILILSFLLIPISFLIIKSKQEPPNNTVYKNAILESLNKGELVHWNLPRQDQIFIGREQQYKVLQAKLSKNQTLFPNTLDFNKTNRTKLLTIAACAGLAGIGKTQLALYYAHHNQQKYSLIAWFPAENQEILRQKYIELATTLGYGDTQNDPETAILYVKHWLTKHPDWLLIYDNANTYQDIAPFLPDSETGHIILTTRNRSWPDNFEVVSIDVMTEEESTRLIQSLIHRDFYESEKEAVKTLVNLLGNLPLALAQAGAYIRQNQISIGEYLILYKNHATELLSDKTLPEGSTHDPSTVTWNISVSELTNNTKDNDTPLIAMNLLTACAYLGSEKIPKSLLLSFLKECYPRISAPEMHLSKALGLLWKYSLINSYQEGEISVHRLLQTVLRSQHKQPQLRNQVFPVLSEKWYESLLNSAYHDFRRDSNPLEDDLRQHRLMSHLQSLLNYHQSLWPDRKSPALARIHLSISYISWLLGEIKFSIQYAENALEIFKIHFNPNHPEIAKTLGNLGYYYLEINDAKKAKILLDESLRIYEKIQGKNHWKNVSVLTDLGSAQRMLGNIIEAKSILESTLKLIEKYYGNDSLNTTPTLIALSEVYADLKENQLRQDTLERALKIREKHFGKHHPKLIKILFRLSETYSNLGNMTQRKLLLERALFIVENYHGKNHPETAKALALLGKLYHDSGNPSKAKELLDLASRIREPYLDRSQMDVFNKS